MLQAMFGIKNLFLRIQTRSNVRAIGRTGHYSGLPLHCRSFSFVRCSVGDTDYAWRTMSIVT